MRIGIMGGTFDPIHMGHLLAAETVRVEAALDEIWFMPSHIPPHKSSAPAAEANSRWEMVCRATSSHPHFKPKDMELRRGGTSYTYETLKHLLERYPQHRFHFIVGADMVASLSKWYKIEQLAQMVEFIGLERPGTSIDWDQAEIAGEPIRMITMPAVDISSTDIRNRRKSGKSVRYLVHDQVMEYMEENRLYEQH